MAEADDTDGGGRGDVEKRRRLAEALRANLRRRKAQGRARRMADAPAGDAAPADDHRGDGVAGATEPPRRPAR